MHTQHIRTSRINNIIVFHYMLTKTKENLSKVGQVTDKSSEDPTISGTTTTEGDEAHLQSLQQQVEVSMHCIVSELEFI